MINEILINHELTRDNVKYIYYSNNNNNTLFISFAGLIDKYVSSTWFYNQFEFQGHFLFLKNDEENYNTYSDKKFETLIEFYLEKYKINNLITFGPSMGGIAALKFGLKYNANLMIAIDPNPINYNYKELIQQIKSKEDNYDYTNKIYINYTFINDFNTIPIWTEEIINELKLKNILLTIQPFRSINHLDFIPSKKYLINLINIFNIMKVEIYSTSVEWV